jgi:malonyl-CoA O-methyltransferase
MQSVFVTGTDTGVGKTVVSACLARRWGAAYWKPIQTGLAQEPGDTETVAWLAGLPPGRLHTPRYSLAAPLSPEAAGELEGVAIRLVEFALPEAAVPLVVEGAGGVLVPLGAGACMADLMAAFGLPVVLVARSGLGTINHTLLSLEALRRRGLGVLGVVMVGEPNPGNRRAIERHGDVAVMAELPVLAPLCPEAVAAACAIFPA